MSLDPVELLIFEPDRNVQSILRGFLAEDRFNLRFAETADHLRESIRNDSIEVVVMNLLLSDSDGLRLCGEVRDGRDGAKLKIIVCSFLHAEDWVLDAGADAFIQLPFSSRRLITTIDRVTGRSHDFQAIAVASANGITGSAS